MMNEDILERKMDRKKTMEWALVLDAMNIAYRLVSVPGGRKIEVDPLQKEEALLQIGLYENENRFEGQPENEALPFHFSGTLTVLVFFFLFHFLTQNSFLYLDWYEAGYLSGLKLTAGEWWRTVTALTLHADFIHFSSNIALTAILIQALSAETGFGLAWFIVLLSGISGNTFDVIFSAGNIRSIGFSTSVFGSVGILGAVNTLRRRKLRGWVPMAGAAAILGFFGSGQNADIAAHLFGFLSGIIIGFILMIFLRNRLIPGKILQWFFGFIALIIVCFSWWAALK